MAVHRICNYCGLGYTDEEGPHPYKTCEERLRKEIALLVDRAILLNQRLQEVRTLVDERNQRQ